jgi:hypothetical protein
MNQLQTLFQRRVFLSLSGRTGREAADSLIKQWSSSGYGSISDFWAYHHHSTQGALLTGEYLSQLYNSHFYVPVLTSEFVDGNSVHIEEELSAAVSVQQDIQATSGAYRFIVPYFPDGPIKEARLPHLLRGRVGGDKINTAETLHKAITASEGHETFRCHSRSLDDWPDVFFDDKGGAPDAMFVIGHTQKEGTLMQHRLSDFRKWGILDRDPEAEGVAQSLRPAQMVPALQRHLYDLWLSRRGRKAGVLPKFPCEIDRHLINYRWELLGQHNLICLGAGDTNWISRALQRYYRSALLGVRFGKPDSSQSIVINTRDNEKDKTGKLVLGNATNPEAKTGYVRHISQVEANDDWYSALIIALPNPWNINKTVLLCAGLTGLGTQAAMFALMDPQFKAQIRGRRFPHIIVIKGKEQDWRPIDYEVVL